jgi:NCAIR mutase (PurE)-related protein
MNPAALLELLTAIQEGKVAPEEAMNRLAHWPGEDIGFARIDHQRALRTGLPEVIYAAGKTDDQVAQIFFRMATQGGNVLATRATATAAEAVCRGLPAAHYNPVARTIVLRQHTASAITGPIAILSAGTSDLPIVEEAAVTAELLGHSIVKITDVGVAGLHRLLAQREVLSTARVIIVCAGMEGALPTVVAGLVRAPVIAVPTSVGYGASFEGITALLGMLNSCAPNVAVMNIDNGFGAACFAHTILNTASA